MPITEVAKIWMDGELVDWADAKVHVLTPTLHYGWGVFEGIRAYATPDGPAVFQHRPHMERLHRSARILQLQLPYSVDELMAATRELVRVNDLESCYIRPLVYLGYGEMGLNPLPSTVRVMIACWPWGTYLGEEGIANGVRAKISSWQRIGANMIPTGAKAAGVYINSSLAKVEALKAGYDEAAAERARPDRRGLGREHLRGQGRRAEDPAPVGGRPAGRDPRHDLRVRPRPRHPAGRDPDAPPGPLPGRRGVLHRRTAAEVVPIRSVDERDIGAPGPITKQLQDLFFAVVAGKEPRYAHMLDHVKGG